MYFIKSCINKCLKDQSSGMSSGETTDTQPIEEEENPSLTAQVPLTTATWCWLVSIDPVSGQTLVGQDSVGDIHQLRGVDRRKVGRNSNCDVVLRETLFLGSSNEDIQMTKLSRIQFELFLSNNVVVIEDTSMNGTYVNGVLVGNGGILRLHHGDVISVLQRNFKVFRCLSEIEMRVLHSPEIVSKYLIGRDVSSGSSGIVREGFIRDSLVRVAMKFIRKDLWPSKYSKPNDLMNEVNILKRLRHPCITGVLDVLDTPKVFVIVLDFVTGGELFDHVCRMTNNLEEKNAKFFFFQLSHTLAYLHMTKVCHRDLKLDNILMSDLSSRSLIKVTDFGLAKIFGSQGKVLQTYVGTPVYMAPEVILVLAVDNVNPSYTCKSDCWSLGVVLYVLLCGYHPFIENNDNSGIRSKVLSGSYLPLVGDRWTKVSSLAKDLVKGLLTVDPEKRLSASQVMAHPWLTEDPDLCMEAWLTMGMGIERTFTAKRSVGFGVHQDKKIKLENGVM